MKRDRQLSFRGFHPSLDKFARETTTMHKNLQNEIKYVCEESRIIKVDQ